MPNIFKPKILPSPTRGSIKGLDGCKLLYTSSPGTNSPIQRTFTAFDGVSVYQVVNAIDTENSFLPDKLPDVSNTVCFGETARLRVTALASTVRYFIYSSFTLLLFFIATVISHNVE